MHASLLIGLRGLGANPLRTALSTLGVVVGVGALVSILAMGDGVERVARAQIEQTTDLQTVVVTPRTTERIDGVSVPIRDRVHLGETERAEVRRTPGVTAATLIRVGAVAVRLAPDEAPRGATLTGAVSDSPGVENLELTAGAWPRSPGATGALPNAAVSAELAEALVLTVGDTLLVGDEWWLLAGIFDPQAGAASLQVFIPFELTSLVWPEVTRRPVERLYLEVGEVEAVPTVVDSTRAWAARRFPGGAIDVLANRARVEQVRQAMLVFKLLMGAIAGISLIVGGIGIMNVLLASVTERTREIGVRKAVGARQRDILLQFLTEAVAVTGAGSAFGLLLGIGTAHLVAVFMRRQTEAEIFPLLTAPTILVAVTAAVTVGLAFGLYPALRAARLSPIEAIRHE